MTRFWLIVSLICLYFYHQKTQANETCEGINFHYVEAMESQGIFGSETPTLYPQFTVEHALRREVSISGYPELIGHGRYSVYGQRHEAWGRFNPRHHYWAPEERMKYSEFCSVAKSRNITNLSFVCKGDSSSSPARIMAECFISTHFGGGDLEDYEEKRWGSSQTRSSRVRYGEGGRYEALKLVSNRMDLYGPVLRDAINQVVEIELNPPSPTDLAQARNLNYLAEIHGSGDITISPGLANCIGQLDFETFKKWADWDKSRFPNRPPSVRVSEEVIETIIFFLVVVLPFL